MDVNSKNWTMLIVGLLLSLITAESNVLNNTISNGMHSKDITSNQVLIRRTPGKFGKFFGGGRSMSHGNPMGNVPGVPHVPHNVQQVHSTPQVSQNFQPLNGAPPSSVVPYQPNFSQGGSQYMMPGGQYKPTGMEKAGQAVNIVDQVTSNPISKHAIYTASGHNGMYGGMPGGYSGMGGYGAMGGNYGGMGGGYGGMGGGYGGMGGGYGGMGGYGAMDPSGSMGGYGAMNPYGSIGGGYGNGLNGGGLNANGLSGGGLNVNGLNGKGIYSNSAGEGGILNGGLTGDISSGLKTGDVSSSTSSLNNPDDAASSLNAQVDSLGKIPTDISEITKIDDKSNSGNLDTPSDISESDRQLDSSISDTSKNLDKSPLDDQPLDVTLSNAQVIDDSLKLNNALSAKTNVEDNNGQTIASDNSNNVINLDQNGKSISQLSPERSTNQAQTQTDSQLQAQIQYNAQLQAQAQYNAQLQAQAQYNAQLQAQAQYNAQLQAQAQYNAQLQNQYNAQNQNSQTSMYQQQGSPGYYSASQTNYPQPNGLNSQVSGLATSGTTPHYDLRTGLTTIQSTSNIDLDDEVSSSTPTVTQNNKNKNRENVHETPINGFRIVCNPIPDRAVALLKVFKSQRKYNDDVITQRWPMLRFIQKSHSTLPMKWIQNPKVNEVPLGSLVLLNPSRNSEKVLPKIAVIEKQGNEEYCIAYVNEKNSLILQEKIYLGDINTVII